MSRYLVDTANVEVVPQTEVCALEGVDGTHQEVVLVGGANSAGQAAVFLFVYEKCEQIRRGSDNPKSRKKPYRERILSSRRTAQ